MRSLLSGQLARRRGGKASGAHTQTIAIIVPNHNAQESDLEQILPSQQLLTT